MRIWWCNQSGQWDVERPSRVVCSADPTARGGNARYRKTVAEVKAGDLIVDELPFRALHLGASNHGTICGRSLRLRVYSGMRRAFAALLFVLPIPSAPAADFTAKVVGISDGDTITVLRADKQQVKIRLHGVDAPESAQPFGSRSKQSASDLAFSKTVTVQPRDVDGFASSGRQLRGRRRLQRRGSARLNDQAWRASARDASAHGGTDIGPPAAGAPRCPARGRGPARPQRGILKLKIELCTTRPNRSTDRT